jgi:hypothetical protein
LHTQQIESNRFAHFIEKRKRTMKKVLVLGLMALALALLTHQEASAYKKFNFGVGLNLSCEGANNSIMWGVAKGGPGPGWADGGFPGGYGYGNPDYFGGQPFGHDQAPAMTPSTAPTPTTPPRPMPMGTPGVAQPVGYFPTYGSYSGSNYPMYYYYPMAPR